MTSRFKIIFSILFSGFLTVGIQSCFNGDDYDFDRLSDKVNWTPNMIAPVGYGTYSLWYLLNQHEANPADQTITLDAEGFLHIKYLEEGIFDYSVEKVLSFPDQNNLDFTYNLPDVSMGVPYSSIPQLPQQTESIQIQTNNLAIKLTELDLGAIIQFQLTNPLDTEIELSISLPSGTQNGIPVSETFTLPPHAVNHLEYLDLTNLHILFNTPYTSNNEFDITFDVTIADNGTGIITGTGDLGIKLLIQNIYFNMAQGDFGQQLINIGTGNIDMNVDFWDDIDGDYQFVDPKINLNLENSVGVPFQINANITGYSSNGSSTLLNPDALQPNYPSTLAEVSSGITEIITYDKNNSNIVALMALPPSDRLEYFGSVALNPNVVDIVNAPNIITKDSKIDVDIEIDVPLDFTATNLMLRDTINDLDINDADKIMNAAVVITAKNGYPLNVSIDKIYFTDALYNPIDSISDNDVIDAANVYTSGLQIGEVDESTIKEVSHEIQLTQSQIANLNKTKNFIINASVSTGNSGVPVKLKGEYELKFAISVQAQIDLNN